jgi:type IV pilus assembly protein PilE
MQKTSRGFSLIELMVAVVIVGILAGIAYPSYNAYVLKANRTEAKTRLLQIAQLQERNFTEKNTYTTNCAGLLGVTGTVYSASSNSDSSGYQITCASGASPLTIANSYLLSAVPQGNQTNDTKCGTLTLTHTGAKQISGGSGTAAECWGK